MPKLSHEGGVLMDSRCLFCGGDASAPDHLLHCDGRQGRIDADDTLPLLISGLTPDTRETSTAAAVSVIESKDTQREHVFDTIRRGSLGRTDDEVQALLGIDGSSERPRRWELWKQGRIEVLRDGDGKPVKRLTRTQHRAVVWIPTTRKVVN